ncbi:hypothetical protein Tco_1284808 [Tanacetum coccineum]
MSSMGELTFFLGLQVKQKDDGIFISQDKYVADILKKFDFSLVKTAGTLLKTNKALIKDEEAEDMDRIFGYLKGQPKLGLWYTRDSLFDLEAFSDSDYARASLDRKSTTGGCQSHCNEVTEPWRQDTHFLAKVGKVAYRLELPQELSRVHHTFHVSNLKKCYADEPIVMPLEGIHVDDKLQFVEEPVEIMEREIKRLKRSRIPLVKVRWNSRRGPEFTWEREDSFKQKYPQLFTNRASSSTTRS